MASEQGFSWRRCIALAVALGAHAVLLVSMTLPMRWAPRMVAPEAPGAESWNDPSTPVAVALPLPRAQPERAASARDAVLGDAPQPRGRGPQRPSGMPPGRQARKAVGDRALEESEALRGVDAGVPVARALVYLDDEARARLPYEPLYSAAPPKREGDWYTPGDGSEDDVFYRPKALEPNTTRFARAWRPTSNLLDEWLGQLVEATSGELSVPLNPKFSLVCKASIAGLGGACGIVRNGGTGVIVQRPPPAPWERSNRVQCRELRERLEAAEEAAQVAYFLDRLSALCSVGGDDDAEMPPGGGNEEARREAGLPFEAAGDRGSPDRDQR